jgi:peroxiredoxin
MNIRLLSIGCLGLASLLAASAPPAVPAGGARGVSQDEPAAAQKAKVGEKAPNFTLEDLEGEAHQLSDLAGKIVVLEWINPRCPVCQRVYTTGIIRETIDALQKLDEELVYITINSTADQARDRIVEESGVLLEKNKIDVPALIDYDGKVGKMYGARTTPHMYVIDAEGVLRYQGAIDDDQHGGKKRRGEMVTNYVINAVKQMKAGETVTPDETRPYGCEVKYKKS